jgi:tetratricopeptide (TPR) repeat protein
VVVERENRWRRRVAIGERMVADGRLPAAQAYLEDLNAAFPARDARHARDKERERLLLALGQTYEGLGRKNKALQTYTRLAQFDPRNWMNHEALADAYTRLDENWSMPEETGLALTELLRIYPNHLPSVAKLITYYFDRPDFRSIVTTFETYLNADLYIRGWPRLAADSIEQLIMVDGRWHQPVFTFPSAPAGARQFRLPVSRYNFEVRAITLRPALIVGRPPAGPIVLLPDSSWGGDSLRQRRPGLFEVTGPAGSLSVPLPGGLPPIASVEVDIRLYKPFDEEAWGLVHRAYRTILRPEGIVAAEDRLFPREPGS